MSISLDINTSEVPSLPEDDQILQFTLACRGHHGNLPLPQQMHCQHRSYDDRIKICGNTTFPHQIPKGDVCKGIHSPVVGTHYAYEDIEIQRGTFNDDPIQACDGKPAYPSFDMDGWKIDISSTQKSLEHYCYDSVPQTKKKVAESGVSSRQEKSSRRRDISRRIRTAEKALETVLPQSTEGDTQSLVDGIIGYIKFLQLQVKELSRSRLGSDSISNPLVYVEVQGSGHYFLHEHWASKSLEEKMGELLESDPSAATRLLESRGLSVMPIALANLAKGLQ